MTPEGVEHGFTASTSTAGPFPDDLRCHCGRWTWGELNEQDKEKKESEEQDDIHTQQEKHYPEDN